MMNVRVEMEINFITEKNLYEATIYLFLPAIKGYLHPLLQNSNRTIYKHQLKNNIGYGVRENNLRYIDIKLEAKNIEDLNKKIEETITTIYDTLKQVYHENKQKVLLVADEYDLVIE